MSQVRTSYHAHLTSEGYAGATVRVYVKDLEALEAFAGLPDDNYFSPPTTTTSPHLTEDLPVVG